MRVSLPATLALSAGLVTSRGVPPRNKRQAAGNNPYVPAATSCPAAAAAIRPAGSLHPNETEYVQQRSAKAAPALASWLAVALDGFVAEKVPALAVALSGGGTKAGLTTAGAVYGLDGRESSGSPAAGLLQATTYISALSGGSLTLSGIMSNDFAQVSAMRSELWDQSYQNAFTAVLDNSADVRADVGNKSAAGYPTTLIDIYGKVISYNFITSTGGRNLHWSAITSQPSFQNHDAPYPIITITEANVAEGACVPPSDGAIWEIAPVEFGSWDSGVDAFYPTQYMGTPGNSTPGQCVTSFDNTGFITAISSNILINEQACVTGNYSAELLNPLASTVNTAFAGLTSVNPYAIIPSPFYQDPEAGPIRNQDLLFGTDGGTSGQGIPVFPWLQPERAIDVVILVDAATQQPGNITNGTWLYSTYTSARENGLSKMPEVPTPEQFVEQGLSAKAQFYGCHDANVTTLIYLPNTEQGDASTDFFLTPEQINSTIDGGLSMVTQSQSDIAPQDWAACLACGIAHKSAAQLPEVCTGCLERYCWPRGGRAGNVTDESGSGGGGGGNGSPTPVSSTGGSAKITFSMLALVTSALAFFL